MKNELEKNSDLKASEKDAKNGTSKIKKTPEINANIGDNSEPKEKVPVKKKKGNTANNAPRNTLQSAKRIDKVISGGDDFLRSQYLQFYADMNSSKLFPNPELALRRMSETVNEFKQFPKQSIRNINELFIKLKKDYFNAEQKIIMFEWAAQLFEVLEHPKGVKFQGVSAIFRSHADRLKPIEFPEKQTLKEKIDTYLRDEIEMMPQLVENLQTKERLSWDMKLMQHSNDVIKSISAEMPFVIETLNTLGNLLNTELKRNHGNSK